MNIDLIQTLGSVLLVVTLMFATGLKLVWGDLVALRRRPGPMLWGLVVNLVAVPALAWVLVSSLGLPPLVALGIVLCAAAPGGPAAILYVTMAGADLALAVGMTIVLPAIAVVSTPLTLSLLVELEGSVPVLPMLGALVGMQMMPLAIGMLLRRHREALATRLARPFTALANAILAGLVLFLLITKGYVLADSSPTTWLVIMALTVAALVLGYGRPGAERDTARASSLVGASRNSSVAIMLSSTFFADPVVDATVLGYSLMALLAPIFVAQVWRRGGSSSA
ncbi:MAG: bile acid:sodium symporter [Myxococcota bacterium]